MNAFRDLGNLLLQLLPTSRFFGAKRLILTLMGVEVESGASVNGRTWFYGPGRIRIGRNTWIGPGCRFYTSQGTTIDIGANCDVAPEVSFVTGTHAIGTHERRAGSGRAAGISVGDGCWLGMRVTVLGGVQIGPGTVVGACTLVRTELPADCVAVGVPAIPRKWLAGADGAPPPARTANSPGRASPGSPGSP